MQTGLDRNIYIYQMMYTVPAVPRLVKMLQIEITTHLLDKP